MNNEEIIEFAKKLKEISTYKLLLMQERLYDFHVTRTSEGISCGIFVRLFLIAHELTLRENK